MAEDAALIDLATAIADGAPIDWSSVESSGASATDSDLVTQLRVIAEIVSLQHRLASAPAHTSVVDELRDDHLHAMDTREALPSWGPLRLMALVGHGAFGEVYRAWDSRLDREVALKLLRRRESRRAAGSSLVDEGRLLAKVRHPNVITVYGAEHIGDHAGIWMEFIDGRTLEQELASNGPFPPAEIARTGTALCGAVAAVHRAGLLHRDIKAQNVMRDADGRVVLMDFGAGRENRTPDDRHGDVAGTPLYLAPEIFEGAASSAQSDVYSLGVLLYHVATGGYPIEGRTVEDVRRAHLRGERRSIARARADLPRVISQIIDRALSADPAARFSSADDMGRALEAASGARFALAAWLLAAVTIVVVAVIAVMMLNRPTTATAGGQPLKTISGDAAVTVRRLGQPDDVMADGIPSPDGRYLPYSESRAGNLVVLDLVTGAKRQLTHFKADKRADGSIDAATMARDDSRVAYAWTTDHGSELRVVNSDGSDSRSLIAGATADGWSGVEPFEWTPDGRWVLAAIHRRDATHSIALVPTDGGSARIVKTTRRFSYRLSLSPDGRYVAYDAAPDAAAVGAHDLYVVAVDGSSDARVVEDPADDTSPIWTPDGKGLLFTSDRTGGSGLWWVRIDRGRATAPPVLVNRDMGRITPVGVTEQGTFFYLRQTGMADVYAGELDPASGRFRGSAAAVARVFVGQNISPDWSPDGRFLAYVSQRGAGVVGPSSRVLVIRSLADGRERTISPPLDFYIAPRWARDGRSIYLKSVTASDVGLVRVDAETGAVLWSRRTTLAFFAGELSADGRSYLATENGRVVTIDLDSGRATEVPLPKTTRPQAYVALSPDQRSVAFSTFDSIAVVSRRGGEPRVLVHASRSEVLALQAWEGDGTHVLFTKTVNVNGQNGGPGELWRVNVANGRSEPLGLSMVGLREVRLHPDGRRIAFSAGWPTLELWTMENFSTALRPAKR